MKSNKGYFLIEYVISISILLFISSFLVGTFVFCKNISNKLSDKIELINHSIEINNQIDKIISNSKGILSISKSYIKLKYKDDFFKEDKVILFRSNIDKVFINDLNLNGTLKPGGYEIGAYVDDLNVIINGQIATVNLKLKKDKVFYESTFDIFIKNSEVL